MLILEFSAKLLMGIALVIAIWRHSELKKSTQNHFIYFLSIMIVIEFGAELCITLYGNNVLIYNFYDLFTGIFFCYWFYRILYKKIWVYIIVTLLTICLVTSILVENWLLDYNVIFLFSVTIALLVLVFRFYIEFLNNDDLIEFKQNPKFWITTGILIFNLGYLPIQVYISKINGSLAPSLYIVIAFLNIPLYGCIITALLCPQKN
ncbi:hypothetical protein [Leeuwenhoekiella sp. MAR_2009_132]|uniref:hypothetical protein n=1 Tax=Leeuwenhoekiella sp. MAR_2009_132 TaxID=1392489 RepID=UPI0004918E53|nr:hypothetical protein [Leeuwenhoekiella sp. MAR_2009_132]